MLIDPNTPSLTQAQYKPEKVDGLSVGEVRKTKVNQVARLSFTLVACIASSLALLAVADPAMERI